MLPHCPKCGCANYNWVAGKQALNVKNVNIESLLPGNSYGIQQAICAIMVLHYAFDDFDKIGPFCQRSPASTLHGSVTTCLVYEDETKGDHGET